MVPEFEACAECTHRCLLAHGKKKNGSHIDTSFFKIMFGKQFSKFMELPPKVARIVLLSDRTTFLEDLCGQRWNIAISSINGSLAFQKGWNAFASDHDLQPGDFLVFNYIVGSHFTVRIYDSSGCELNLFKTIHYNNRNRNHTDGQCHPFVRSSASKSPINTFAGPNPEISKGLNELNVMKKPQIMITENASDHDDNNEKSKGKRKAEFAEDISCMMNRDFGNRPGENRAHILDLSSVESHKKIRTCSGDGANKVSVVNETHTYLADQSLEMRIKAGSVSVAKEVANTVIPLDAAALGRTKKNNCSESKVKGASLSDKDSSTNVTSGHSFPTLPKNTQQNNIFSSTLFRAAQNSQSANASGNDHHVAVSGQENGLMNDTCQSVDKKNIGISKSCGVPITSASQNVMKVIGNGPVELNSHPCTKEVVSESNDDATIITEQEFEELAPDPCSQEVTPKSKDEATTAIQNVIVDLTSDECSKDVTEIVQLNAEELLDVLTKVDNQSSNSQPRDTPSVQAEFVRTELHTNCEVRVRKVLSDKDSCKETSGHPFPTHSESPEEIGESITDTSKTTCDDLNKPTCQNTDLAGKDQLALIQMEPTLMVDSVPRDNKEVTGISESNHDPIRHKLYNTIINEKESLEATCQEIIPQREDKIIIEGKNADVTSEPCSQQDVPKRNETIIIEDGSAELSLNPSCQEVIPKRKRESIKCFNRYRKHPDTNIRADKSDATELETEKSEDLDVKVTKVSTSEKVPHANQTSFHLNAICPLIGERFKSITKVSNEGIKKLKSTDGSVISGNVQVSVSQKEQVSSDASFQKKIFTGVSKVYDTPVKFRSQDYSAQLLKIPNKLQSQSMFAGTSDITLPVVKSEPVEDEVATFPNFTISCLATDQSYLELPKSLPLSLKTTRGRTKMDRRVVYLQGPDNRLWPVLYIQKFYFRTLANGWGAFRAANNIEIGDLCTIVVTNPTKGICALNIAKMRDDM